MKLQLKGNQKAAAALAAVGLGPEVGSFLEPVLVFLLDKVMPQVLAVQLAKILAPAIVALIGAGLVWRVPNK